MSEEDQSSKPAVARWFEEQQAWQKTMRDYADAMVKDEQFLMHMGNAMRGSLLAGVPYPDARPGAEVPAERSTDLLEEVLFELKRIEGRLRDLEDAVTALGAEPTRRDRDAHAADGAPDDSTTPDAERAPENEGTGGSENKEAAGELHAPRTSTQARRTAKAPKAPTRAPTADADAD